MGRDANLAELAVDPGILERILVSSVDTTPRLAGDADTLETLRRPPDDERPSPESRPDRAEGALRPGERIGRYHILEEIGRGGMGTVYSAFDAALERRVAIKVLHRGQHGAPEERARLLSEAKAMAQLSHPNVVTVHEAAVDRGRVYLAMEYVPGRTARSWLAQRERTWREIVAVYRQAALGLAGAHAAGLVHRDVKPDNILVGTDERVRITDFGIAVGLVQASSRRSGDEVPAVDHGEEAQAHVTMTTGTPAYMSPEHLRGGALDGRSDQFSFGVVLFEALFGRRPFAGSRPTELRAAHAHAAAIAPTDNDVPTWLRKVVLRAVEIDPDKRWASMQALTKQLDLGTSPISRPLQRWLLVLVPVGVIGGVLVGGQVGPEPLRCEQAAAMALTWGDGQRERVTRSLTAPGPEFAGDTARTVVKLLDAYTEQWTAMYQDACGQHRSGVESDSLFDRRQSCLRARHRAVSALVDILGEADGDTTRNAIAAVDALPPLRECEPARLIDDTMWAMPTDPEQRADHEAVLDALGQAQAMLRAGRFHDGLAQANAVVASARALGDDAVLARGLMVLASYQEKLDQTEAAVASVDEAWHLALRSGNTIDAVRASIRQILLVGYEQRNEALATARVGDAQSLIERIRVRDPETATELQAGVLRACGLVELRFARPSAARRLAEALDMIRSLPARHDLEIADYLRALANAEFPAGRHDDALAHYQEALDLETGVLGPSHPDVGRVHNNLGLLLRNMDRAQEGAAHLEQALQIAEAAFGHGHSSVIMAAGNLASVYHQMGDAARAVPLWQHALGGLPIDLDSAEASTAMRALEFGRDLIAVARADDALRLFDDVLAHDDEATVPTRTRIAALRDRAGALRALGRIAQADQSQALADQLARESTP